DPAMEIPEHRVHMRRERVAEKVVLRRVPTTGEVRRVAGKRYRGAVGRVPWHRGPAHVQPIVQPQLDLRAKLPQGELRQITRIAVPRLPDLEIAVVGLGRLDVADPLGVVAITTGQPGGR